MIFEVNSTALALNLNARTWNFESLKFDERRVGVELVGAG